MRGADGVRDELATFLAAALPLKIPALRQAWNLDQGTLPDVGAISSGEMPQEALTDIADTWVEIINPRMLPGLKWVDITPAGDPQYHIRYACRIYVWALGADWDQALARRDMIAVAVRLCLLEFPTLTLAGGDTDVLVLQETWSEEYGVPSRAPNDSGRCWCSAVLSVDARSEEDMGDGRLRAPLGTTQRVLLAAGASGPTTQFPDDIPTPSDYRVTNTGGSNGG